MKILSMGFEPGTLSDEVLERVRRLAPDYRLLVSRDREEIIEVLDEIEIAAGEFPTELVARAPRLRWFQQWGAGADWLERHPEAKARSFVLTNASGVHAVPISEHILAGLLALGRRLPQALAAQGERTWWRPESEALAELAGKTMLLLGVGAIGRRTARLARAFDMRVVGVVSRPDRVVEEVDDLHGPGALTALLPDADALVLTLPLTPETRGIVGARELAAMKPGGVLVNIGRGGLVDEEALIDALRQGTPAGAALDVFEDEPLSERSPLWTLPNVIVTAHYAGLTPRYDERAAAIFLDNLERFVTGRPLRNVVDKERGY